MVSSGFSTRPLPTPSNSDNNILHEAKYMLYKGGTLHLKVYLKSKSLASLFPVRIAIFTSL